MPVMHRRAHTEPRYIACPRAGSRTNRCFALCTPIAGRGDCGRIAGHAQLGRTQQAILERRRLEAGVTVSQSRSGERAEARRLLEAGDLDAVARWAGRALRASQVLQSLLFDDDGLVRWRAVEAIGRTAAQSGADRGERLDRARELVRRVLWLMNDESGGVLWLGPQVIGSVLAHVPELADDFGPILASFLEEEPFRAGTRWGLWRLCASRPDVVERAAPDLAGSLADRDAAVRGHTALVLSTLHAASLESLARDDAPVVVFDYRALSLRSTTVAELARGGL
jgi:hypothetical protein